MGSGPGQSFNSGIGNLRDVPKFGKERY